MATTKTLKAYVPLDLAEVLADEAARRKISQSKAVEVAITHWLMTVNRYPQKHTYQQGRK
ncbi:ribbon-helix-helix protein, CopG family [Leptolyngbya iicbica]|uniref:ribbon-helix-helix protein, CopG family n=1 Tax=Leptolyngbya iicbica TaxID=3161580 RepID=UPI000584F1ED